MYSIRSTTLVVLTAILLIAGCIQGSKAQVVPAWEAANPILPLPMPPLGIRGNLTDLPDPPTPQRVRLGRWLFFDKRLSADGTVSCASCHRSENAFSEPVAVSTGVRGQKLLIPQPEGRPPVPRKTPSLINQAWMLAPNFFWDGRINSLDELDVLPIVNPLAMGSTFAAMIQTLNNNGYAPYFKESFGTEEITKERVGKAIADYQRTRMSGNSPYDRWKTGGEANAVSAEVKKGEMLFSGKAGCAQCHIGQSFTDNIFHNLGIGWDPSTRTFKDQGRFGVTKTEKDRGGFRTPPLRDVNLHPPYMHDGSLATLQEVVEHYNKGGNPNPNLSPLIKPLKLTNDEVYALVAFLEALKGEGYQDNGPRAFPQEIR